MTYIPDVLRNLVYERASGRCEYCLLHERYTIKRHEVDHIYAEKHGGKTVEDNLGLSCFDCNRHKGSDLASLDPVNNEIVPLFHPRKDLWEAHFKLDGAFIQPLTPQGRVTVRLLQMNSADRIDERALLITIGRYP